MPILLSILLSHYLSYFIVTRVGIFSLFDVCVSVYVSVYLCVTFLCQIRECQDRIFLDVKYLNVNLEYFWISKFYGFEILSFSALY